MATYKPKRKTNNGEEEVKFPASAIDGLAAVATSGSYTDLKDKPIFLEKTTYEISKELACGQNGKVCLGKFGAYDTNITIELNITTSTTYHATIVIHSQNVVANGTGGAVGCNVYDDADNHITPLLKIFRPYGSASRQIEVYADLPGWSKNLVHVQAVAVSTGGMTDVLTSVTEIPTSIDGKRLITPVNVLYNTFALNTDLINSNSDILKRTLFISDTESTPNATLKSLLDKLCTAYGIDNLPTNTPMLIALGGYFSPSRVLLIILKNTYTVGMTTQSNFSILDLTHTGYLNKDINTVVDVAAYTLSNILYEEMIYVEDKATEMQVSALPGSISIDATTTLAGIRTKIIEAGINPTHYTFIHDGSGGPNTGTYIVRFENVSNSGGYYFIYDLGRGIRNESGASYSTQTFNSAITKLDTEAQTTGYAINELYSKIQNGVATKSEGAIFIEGSGSTDATAKTSTWIGTSDRITEYFDGLTIRYKIGVVGQSTTTLNINDLGAKIVYRFGTSKLTTHFPVGSIIHLIYHADLNDGCWMCSDYDANTNTYQRVYESSSKNIEYPITARYATTTGSTYYAEYGRYSTGVTLNPSTNTITATAFKGNLTGKADSAIMAFKDGSGNVITDTYATKTELGTKLNSSGGTISGNLTITNESSAQSKEPAIKWKTVNTNTPYIGFATDQTDGTFILGSLKGTAYRTGLAIGGGSGNLLWKGSRVATADDLNSYQAKTDTNLTTGEKTVIGAINEINSKTSEMPQIRFCNARYSHPTAQVVSDQYPLSLTFEVIGGTLKEGDYLQLCARRKYKKTYFKTTEDGTETAVIKRMWRLRQMKQIQIGTVSNKTRFLTIKLDSDDSWLYKNNYAHTPSEISSGAVKLSPFYARVKRVTHVTGEVEDDAIFSNVVTLWKTYGSNLELGLPTLIIK